MNEKIIAVAVGASVSVVSTIVLVVIGWWWEKRQLNKAFSEISSLR